MAGGRGGYFKQGPTIERGPYSVPSSYELFMFPLPPPPHPASGISAHTPVYSLSPLISLSCLSCQSQHSSFALSLSMSLHLALYLSVCLSLSQHVTQIGK